MRLGITPVALAIVGVLLSLAMLLTVGWERPPIDSTQMGFRGTGIVDVQNPRTVAHKEAMNVAPPPPYELDLEYAAEGPTAAEFYENVTVLGAISAEEFNHLMAAITEWVSPEQGCNYCHLPDDLASDDIYTKVVARKMIQMTQAINVDWGDHVKQTGVTCYTCHRGQPVPENIWFKDGGDALPPGMTGFRADGQNMANARVGLTSLPSDPLSSYVRGDQDVRVATMDSKGLNDGFGATIQDAEHTYGLMMHMSAALGVNCTYCHNSRAFAVWDQSTPQRTVAWHGLNMLSEVNQSYVLPLGSVLPTERLGPLGDAPAASCATCHQGVAKPLLGAPMAKDYPSLWLKTGAMTAALEKEGAKAEETPAMDMEAEAKE